MNGMGRANVYGEGCGWGIGAGKGFKEGHDWGTGFASGGVSFGAHGPVPGWGVTYCRGGGLCGTESSKYGSGYGKGRAIGDGVITGRGDGYG